MNLSILLRKTDKTRNCDIVEYERKRLKGISIVETTTRKTREIRSTNRMMKSVNPSPA